MRNGEKPEDEADRQVQLAAYQQEHFPIAMIAHGASVQVMLAMLSLVRNVDEAEEKNPK